MDLPAIPAVGSGPQGTVGERVPRVAARVSGDGLLPDATSQNSRQQALTNAISGADAARKNELQAREEKQSSSANQESSPAVGRIRFELLEGTRVAKFFDTKDVLIYQVPPKGRIYLVQAQEQPAQVQVETSA